MRAVSERRRLRFFWWASVKARRGADDDLAVEGAARAPVEDPLVVLLAPAVRPGVVDERVVVDLLLAAGEEEAVERRAGAVAVEPDGQLVPHEPAAHREDVAEELRAGAEVRLGRADVERLRRLLLERRVVEVGVRAEDDLGHRVHEGLAGAAVRLDDRRLARSRRGRRRRAGGTRPGPALPSATWTTRSGSARTTPSGTWTKTPSRRNAAFIATKGCARCPRRRPSRFSRRSGGAAKRRENASKRTPAGRPSKRESSGVEAPVHEDELVVLPAGDAERPEGGERGAGRGGARRRAPPSSAGRSRGGAWRASRRSCSATPRRRGGEGRASRAPRGRRAAGSGRRAGSPPPRARRRRGPCSSGGADALGEGRGDGRGGGRRAQDAVPAPTAASSSSQP